MKTLTVVDSISVDDPGAGKVTVVLSYADVTQNPPQQQVTVQNISDANPNWSRALRLNDVAVLLIRNGANSVALAVEALVDMAVALEPTLTFAPVISVAPDDSTVAAPAAAAFSVTALSELAETYQWQVDTGGGFANVTDAGVYSGATTDSLAISDSTGLDGYIYRCVVTNSIDSTNSDSATLTVT